jgi:hypothetical protein
MSTPWINHDAALSQVRAIGDPIAEQFVMRAVMLVVNANSAGKVPDEKFDMLFFVERMVEFFGQKDALSRILAGEDLRWWPDDDG